MTPIRLSSITCPSSSVTATVYGWGSLIEATRPNGMFTVAAPAGWMSRAPLVTVASAVPDSTSLPPGAMILYCITGEARESPGRGAALAAEFRAVQRGSAVSAEFLRRPGRRQGMAAVSAELPAAAGLAAVRARPGSLVAVVDVLRPVDVLDLAVQLLDLGLRLHARDLLVELGRALHAQAALVVPADGLADPLAAALALVEVRLHLVDGLGERLVAGRP